MRFVRGIGRTFIVIGLTLLLFVVYELVGTSLVTKHNQSVLGKEVDSNLVETPTVGKDFKSPGLGRPIGRIKIPRINLNVVFVQGTTLKHLAKGPGHYPQTPMPWQKGSTGIAGHRTGWGQPFFNLDKLKRGDEITLETVNGTFHYRVTKAMVVGPGDAWVLDGNPASKVTSQLTLTTCTPKYTSRRRLIFWADSYVPPPPGTS